MTVDKRRRAQSKIVRQVRKAYPDAYVTPGLGWCGPAYEAAAALEQQLLIRAQLHERS